MEFKNEWTFANVAARFFCACEQLATILVKKNGYYFSWQQFIFCV